MHYSLTFYMHIVFKYFLWWQHLPFYLAFPLCDSLKTSTVSWSLYCSCSFSSLSPSPNSPSLLCVLSVFVGGSCIPSPADLHTWLSSSNHSCSIKFQQPSIPVPDRPVTQVVKLMGRCAIADWVWCEIICGFICCFSLSPQFRFVEPAHSPHLLPVFSLNLFCTDLHSPRFSCHSGPTYSISNL